MRIRTLADSAIPVMIKSIFLRVKYTRFLSGLWPVIYSTDVHLIKGKKKSSNLGFTTLAFGDVQFSHYFANLVYSDDYEIKALAKATYYDIPKIINHTDADIILVQADGALSRFLSRLGFLILPKICFTLNVSASERLFARVSRLRRRNISMIKKQGFTYEITREPEKLDFFYSSFYLPYIFKRHGKSARQTSFFEMKQIYRKGGLLFVKLNEKYVSGILYNLYGGIVCACCLGIYKGKRQHLEEGASQAAFYFLVEWSKLKGFKEINYGLCNPFMNDGLFAYKKSWGMKAKPCKDLIYGLRVSKLNTSVVEFLSENPLVFSESETLSGLVFRKVEGETEEGFRASSYYTPGLSRIVVGLYPARDLPPSLLDFSKESSKSKVSKKKVTPYLFKLWSKRGGKFYEKVYSSQ